MAEFEITYTFGHDPLQQYLVPFPGGRLQALSLAWDSRAGGVVPPLPRSRHARPTTGCTGRATPRTGTACAPSATPRSEEGLRPRDADLRDDLVGHRRRLRGLPRPGLAARGLGRRSRRWRGPDPADDTGSCPPRGHRIAGLPYSWSSARPATRGAPSSATTTTPASSCSTTCCRRSLREGLYHADGQILDEVYVYGSFLQSKMYARGVSCRDCHDSHSLEAPLRGQRAVPAVPPGRGLRLLRPPLPQAGA